MDAVIGGFILLALNLDPVFAGKPAFSELPAPEHSVEMRLIVDGEIMTGWDANRPLVLPENEIQMRRGDVVSLVIETRDSSSEPWRDVSGSEIIQFDPIGAADVRHAPSGLKLVAERPGGKESDYRWTYGSLAVIYNLEAMKRMTAGTYDVVKHGKVGIAEVKIRLLEQ